MTIEELSARLERVERTNRRLKATGVAALVLVAAGAAMGLAAGPPKLIKAERFEVQDAEGKTRATLGADPDGTPGLSILGVDGKPRAVLALRSGAWPALMLFDGAERARTVIGVYEDGTPSMTLSDGDDRVRVVLGVTHEGEPRLSLLDKDGKVLERLPK